MRAKSIPAADNHIADGDKALLKMTTVLASGTYTLFRETRIIPARILTSGIPHSGQNTRARAETSCSHPFPLFFSSPNRLHQFIFPVLFPVFVFPMFCPTSSSQCSSPGHFGRGSSPDRFFLCSAPIDFSNLLSQIIFSCVLPQFILSHLLPRIIYPKFFASSFFDVFPWFILQCFFPR